MSTYTYIAEKTTRGDCSPTASKDFYSPDRHERPNPGYNSGPNSKAAEARRVDRDAIAEPEADREEGRTARNYTGRGIDATADHRKMRRGPSANAEDPRHIG